jgi:hypothetical protein
MLPNLPQSLQKLSQSLPHAHQSIPMTQKEKIIEIKKRFNLQHGKGKRNKKRR